MKNIISYIEKHFKLCFVLFIIFALSASFLTISIIKTKDHNDRKERCVRVIGIVESSDYKEREVTEIGPDDNHYTTTESYYLNIVKYEYNEKNYTWDYESDMKVNPGTKIDVIIDSTDPEYVFNDGKPGDFFFAFGIIFLIIFILIVSVLVFGLFVVAFALFALSAAGFFAASIMYIPISIGGALLFFVASLAFAFVCKLMLKTKNPTPKSTEL